MYYYKTKDNKGWLEDKLQHNDENLIEITKEEFNEHLNIRKQDFNTKKHRIAVCKEFLNNTDYCVIKIAEGVASVFDNLLEVRPTTINYSFHPRENGKTIKVFEDFTSKLEEAKKLLSSNEFKDNYTIIFPISYYYAFDAEYWKYYNQYHQPNCTFYFLENAFTKKEVRYKLNKKGKLTKQKI